MKLPPLRTARACLAARFGYISTRHHVMQETVAQDDLETVLWLVSVNRTDWFSVLCEAARRGSLDVIEEAVKEIKLDPFNSWSYRPFEIAMEEAAVHGAPETIDFIATLVAERCPEKQEEFAARAIKDKRWHAELAFERKRRKDKSFTAP